MYTYTYTIKQKQTGTGTIHDIASQHHDRDIVFRKYCIYAVVLASYYGGKGYTTHKTEAAAIKASNKHREFSHTIIDRGGHAYHTDGYRLYR